MQFYCGKIFSKISLVVDVRVSIQIVENEFDFFEIVLKFGPIFYLTKNKYSKTPKCKELNVSFKNEF